MNALNIALRSLIGAMTGTLVFILLLIGQMLAQDGEQQPNAFLLILSLGIAFTLVIFWPLVLGFTLIGRRLSRTRRWARTAWGWMLCGATGGAISCALFGAGAGLGDGSLFPLFGAIGGAITAATIFHLYRADG